MSIAMLPSKTLVPSETLADLVEQLGAIPLRRIRLRQFPGTATVHDLAAILERDDRLYELVDGVLVEKTMGFYEGILAGLVLYYIQDYLAKHDRGVVAGADGTLQIAFALVRIPDVSFVSWERLPGRVIPAEAAPQLVPNLAVEVISSGNTRKEMKRKLQEYFAAGVELVWLIYPRTRTAEAYTASDQMVRGGEESTLTGGSVLPGFKLSLKKLFERAGRQARPRNGRTGQGKGKRQD